MINLIKIPGPVGARALYAKKAPPQEIDPMAAAMVVEVEREPWEVPLLIAYRKTGVLLRAAEMCGVNIHKVHAHRKNSPVFEQAFRETRDIIVADLEVVLHERARTKSDALLIMLLKTLAPMKYSGNYSSDFENMSDEELQAIGGVGGSDGAPAPANDPASR